MARSELIISGLIVLALVLGIGVWVPLKLFELAEHRVVDIWVAIGVSVLLWLGVMRVAENVLFSYYQTAKRWAEAAGERKGFSLTAYRARQRAMLEELDEAVKLLREIRDILREASE